MDDNEVIQCSGTHYAHSMVKCYKNVHHTNITAGRLWPCSQWMWSSLDEEATEILRA